MKRTDLDSLKLVLPTDFEILEEMCDGNRQTAPNLAALLDRQRQYMNDRLSALAGYGLVEKVGPSDRSGMYTITKRGLAALKHKDEYSHDQAHEFAKIVQRTADEVNGITKER